MKTSAKKTVSAWVSAPSRSSGSKTATGSRNWFPGVERCVWCADIVWRFAPDGALSHVEAPFEACAVISKNLIIDEDQAVQFLRSRRSIRFFKDEPPDKAVLQRLIEIARYAPTAGNGQLVEWLVMTDRAEIREVAGMVVDWMRNVLEKDPHSAPPYMPIDRGGLGYGIRCGAA